MEATVSKCILCHSNNLKLEQKLSAEDLKKLYITNFGFDISEELHQEKEILYYSCKTCKLYFFDPKFAGSGRFYEDLQTNRKVYYNPNRAEFNYAKTLISKEASVLEIGSGSGFFAKKLQTKKYLGLEYNDKAIKLASNKGIKLLKQSIEDFSKSTTELYDVVCSFHVLEHVPNPFQFLKASIKILENNGLLIISVPYNASKLTNSLNHVLNLPPHHISKWNLETLQYIGNLFNLEFVEYEVHHITKPISKLDYFRIRFLDGLFNLLSANKKVLVAPSVYNKVKRYSDKIIKKSKLYRIQSHDKIIGENITIVFKKC